MLIDKTATVSGGVLEADLGVVGITMSIDPMPLELTTDALPNTISISHLFLDVFNSGGVDPEPEPDPTEFLGLPSMYLGFGGAPPYITAYPIGGI